MSIYLLTLFFSSKKIKVHAVKLLIRIEANLNASTPLYMLVNYSLCCFLSFREKTYINVISESLPFVFNFYIKNISVIYEVSKVLFLVFSLFSKPKSCKEPQDKRISIKFTLLVFLVK